jgi:hypothetical protein
VALRDIVLLAIDTCLATTTLAMYTGTHAYIYTPALILTYLHIQLLCCITEGPQSRDYMTSDLHADTNYNSLNNSGGMHDSFSGSGHNNMNSSMQQHNNSIISSHNAHDEQLVGPARGSNDLGILLLLVIYVVCIYSVCMCMHGDTAVTGTCLRMHEHSASQYHLPYTHCAHAVSHRIVC